jgi:hypothetical protein
MARTASVLRRRSCFHSVPLDLCGGGDADEFVVAQSEGREVEAEGLDDAAGLGIAPSAKIGANRHLISVEGGR